MLYKDKQLIILMAGKGTRLYPLTLGFPKCLLSIKQKTSNLQYANSADKRRIN